ncbi:MAG TPA: ATP-binding protein [Pyrinomonadaceae bacterium]|jgi:anti-sigma regulatory factor (Ser/Thr protein kinase)
MLFLHPSALILALHLREISSIEISHEAQVGTARRAVHDYASQVGFGETTLAEIDIVVQEIGTNAATYSTTGGWLHFTRPLGPAPGLELFYWDTGPGIYNMDRAIRDGVSTSGSLGAGLGAISRLMDEFEIYSTVAATGRLTLGQMRRTSHGTAMLARKWVEHEGGNRPAEREEAQRFGVWSRPHPQEEVNGDAYYIARRGQRTLLSVIDGLGHGHGAKEAADVACDMLDDWKGERPDELLLAAHDALRATRGAVMGIIVIDHEGEVFQYAGVGNIAVRAFGTRQNLALISTNGTLGLRLGSLRLWTYPWVEGATVLMTSDGLSESWDIRSYPGLLKRSPQLMAGLLMRDYGREADDATVLVAR